MLALDQMRIVYTSSIDISSIVPIVEGVVVKYKLISVINVALHLLTLLKVLSSLSIKWLIHLTKVVKVCLDFKACYQVPTHYFAGKQLKAGLLINFIEELRENQILHARKLINI